MSEKNVVINKPCGKNWDDMTPRGEGKFCGHCNKIVIDFTSMTDEQIISYLSKHKGQNTCGYFKDEQVIVKRPKLHEYLLHLHSGLQKNTRVNMFKTFALSLVTFSMIMVGCNRPEKRTQGTNDQNSTNTSSKSPENNGTNTTCDHRKMGEVIEHIDEPIGDSLNNSPKQQTIMGKMAPRHDKEKRNIN